MGGEGLNRGPFKSCFGLIFMFVFTRLLPSARNRTWHTVQHMFNKHFWKNE